jgi:hypothetical protein
VRSRDGTAASKGCREFGRSEFSVTYLWRRTVVLSTENSAPTARGPTLASAAALDPTVRMTCRPTTPRTPTSDAYRDAGRERGGRQSSAPPLRSGRSAGYHAHGLSASDAHRGDGKERGGRQSSAPPLQSGRSAGYHAHGLSAPDAQRSDGKERGGWQPPAPPLESGRSTGDNAH